MRATNQPSLLKNDKGEVYALFLSSDHCAEHEWGIKPLTKSLKVPSIDNQPVKGKEGLDSYRIENTKIEPVVFEDKSTVTAVFDPFSMYNEILENKTVKPEDLKIYVPRDYSKRKYKGSHPIKDFDIAAAWDDQSFAFTVKKENKEIIDKFKTAIQNKDAALHIGGGGPFGGHGLVLSIISLVPEKDKNEMKNSHLETIETSEKWNDFCKKNEVSFERMAVKPMLKEGGFNCHRGLIESKSGIYCFFNPDWSSSKNADFGWYTAEEMAEYIKSPKDSMPDRRLRGKVLFKEGNYENKLTEKKIDFLTPESYIEDNKLKTILSIKPNEKLNIDELRKEFEIKEANVVNAHNHKKEYLEIRFKSSLELEKFIDKI